MRPLRLVLRAFGPYAGEQLVDFRLLGERAFFLVHGPTGAGKTSILDGICYALYGESSGSARDGASLRSDHAQPNVPTEVVLDFELGAERYRVCRRPAHRRPRRRGAGTTTDPPTAGLWLRTSCRTDAEEGTPLEHKAGRVDGRIAELLGFESEQFRQVIMLPQGQFERFLLGDSRERERILEVLFDTSGYARMQEALKEEARTLEKDLARLLGDRQLMLGEVGVGDEQKLEEAVIQLGDSLAGAEDLRRVCAERLEQARQRLELGRADAGKLEELGAANGALSALVARDHEATVMENRAAAARGAAMLHEAARNLREQQQQAATAESVVVELDLALALARDASERAEAALAATAATEHRERRDAARRALDDLRAMADKVRRLAEAESHHDRATRACGEAWRSREQAEGAAAAAAVRLDASRVACDEAQRLAALGGEREQRATALARELDDARALGATEAALGRARETSARAIASRAEGETALTRQRAALAGLQQAWDQGQAAILADRLEAGAPCPVCGSRQHPAPARSEQGLPDESTLEQHRRELRHAELTACELGEATGRAAAALARLEGEAGLLRQRLGERGPQAIAELEGRVAEADVELGRVREAAASLVELEPAARALAIEQERLAQSAQQWVACEQERGKELAAAAALLATRAGEVPAELRGPGALDAALRAAETELRRLDAAMALAQQTARAAAEVVAGRQAAADAAVKQARQALERSRDLGTAFARGVQQAGFADVAAYRLASLETSVIEALEEGSRAYRAEVKSARDRAVRARTAAEGLIPPDLPALEAQAERLELEASEASAVVGARRKELDDLVARGGRLRALSRRAADTELRHAVVGTIADVATGRNGAGVTFQRYVLGGLLDDVLVAASHRLGLMSRGRFQLERARERRDQRTAGGLELEVLDSHTGTRRPVASLSGGECFQAALGLALGLADVVQSYAGGMRLDTIFVDEGFGSLDPDALELALGTLLDLQQGGRLVGIISHVEGLRERIDVRLEVTPGRGGSTARFVLP